MEDFINSQNHSNETLQKELISLKNEIDDSYQSRIQILEEKLQNIRPTAEQSMVMDQVVEQVRSSRIRKSKRNDLLDIFVRFQLRDIETTLEQKTKTLESLHNSTGSNSWSLSATEDVSVHRSRPTSLPLAAPQGSPVHPSPRQHSLTMEGVQRVVDKLSKHSRLEEAAIKRVHDLEMQLNKLRESYGVSNQV